MTLEQLMAMGLTAEQAQKVLDSHKADIKDKFIPKSRFDEVNEELKTAKSQVTDRDKQIDGLKKFEGDKTELETKVKELQAENKIKSEEYEANLATERKTNAIKLSLLDGEHKVAEGAMDLVVGLIDPAKIEIGEDGKIKAGFKEQYDNAVKERGFLFTKTETKKEDSTDNPWLPKGVKPAEPTNDKDAMKTASQFGEMMAQNKLSMMGVAPKAEAPATK